MTEVLSNSAPIPANETERLAALHRYQILDTPPETAFDRITALAARLFDVPIALVSLLDESRAWFKSCYGLGMQEVKRDATLCSFAVLFDDVFIIPNTREDPWFVCNPFVLAEPGIRFYAGAPLLTHDGYNLGTLCLLDYQPREDLNSDQRQTLRDLAAMVVDELELRSAAQKVARLDSAIVNVTQGVDSTTGESFFYALVKQFTQALDVSFAYISKVADSDRLQTISVCGQGQIHQNYEYCVQHSLCEQVILHGKTCCYARDVRSHLPQVKILEEMQAESFLGIPIVGSSGVLIGIAGIIDCKPMQDTHLAESLLAIFALRIATELERQQSEAQRLEMLVREQRYAQQLYEAEQSARIQAESANRMKDEFLAVLSHELRTPLSPILGWSKLLQKQTTDATLKQGLATIERNAKLQTQLIEDLLDVSRILQGKLSLNIHPVNLSELIRAAIDTVQLSAEAKSIQIETALSDGIGAIAGDSSRMQQVVWNLLSNAVKFTPEGGQIKVYLTELDNQAQIQVVDAGIGIAPEFLPYVFERFRQEDGSTTRKFGGLGLGLAIARQIVELQGGTISVSSLGEGKGSTFTVQLPLLFQANSAASETADSQSVSIPISPINGLRILIVDDDDDTRSFLEFILQQKGAIVITVASAIQALEELEQSVPDLLLSDVGMPEMDGYAFIQGLRSHSSELIRRLPAVALTAYAGQSNQQQAMQAGFQQHLSKPVDPDRLILTIASLI